MPCGPFARLRVRPLAVAAPILENIDAWLDADGEDDAAGGEVAGLFVVDELAGDLLLHAASATAARTADPAIRTSLTPKAPLPLLMALPFCSLAAPYLEAGAQARRSGLGAPTMR
ncbi:MAG: hypothetical protein ACRDJU_02920 [Actinomycetota bacterium]